MRLRGERDLLSTATRTSAPARRGALLVLAGAALWGTAGAAQALLDGALPPPVVGAVRTGLGGLALGALALRGPAALRASLTVPGARATLALAGAAIALYQATFFVGVDALGIAVGTIVAVGSAPFFAGTLTRLSGQERPTTAWLRTTLLAVGGLVLLVRPDGAAGLQPGGVLAALTAGLSFGAFTVLTKGLLSRGVRRIDVVAVPFVVGGLLLLPVLLGGISGAAGEGSLGDARSLAVIAWLGLGATAAGYLLFSAGLTRIPAISGATLALAEPLTAMLLGVLVFAERLGPTASAGALLVALALLLTVRRSERDAAR